MSASLLNKRPVRCPASDGPKSETCQHMLIECPGLPLGCLSDASLNCINFQQTWPLNFVVPPPLLTSASSLSIRQLRSIHTFAITSPSLIGWPPYQHFPSLPLTVEMGAKLTLTFLAFTALLLPQPSAALTLSDIQPITGFSNACLTSYDSPIIGCNMTNFFPPTHEAMSNATKTVDTCTSDCRSSLLTIQGYILKGCHGDNVQFGQGVGNDTVISRFILRTGVDWLCGAKNGK